MGAHCESAGRPLPPSPPPCVVTHSRPAAHAAGASDSASAPAPLDCGIELPYWQAEDTRFLGPLRHAAVGNHRLAYRRIPPLYASALPAPPLVLLLGYGQTMGAFSPRLLRALAQSREVVLYDQPAQGLSEVRAGAVQEWAATVPARLEMALAQATGQPSMCLLPGDSIAIT